MSCKHEQFAASVDVHRLGEDDGAITAFIAEVQVRCTQCNTPFHFVCPDAGFSFSRPTVNVGATVMHAPIKPGASAIPHRIRFDVKPC